MHPYEVTCPRIYATLSSPLFVYFLFIGTIFISSFIKSPSMRFFFLAKPTLLFFSKSGFLYSANGTGLLVINHFMMAYLGMATELAVSRAENCLQALALSENTVLMGHLGIIVPFLCFTGIGRYGGINSQCRKSNNHSMMKEVSILYSDET